MVFLTRQQRAQLGRSMMEMLGVLAIVGVLSIGGLMGFKYAIDRKSANDILYDVNMMAALVQTNELLDRMTVGQELAENRLEFIKGSTATFKVGKETDKTIYIDATGVPEKVCTKLLRSDPASVEEIIANMGDGCLEGNENSVVFYLNKKMTKDTQNPDRFKRCETSADCGTCGECKSEICVANATLCGSDKPHCVNMNCSACPSGQAISSGKCLSCALSNIYISNTTQEECAKCSNRFFYPSNNICVLCSFASNIPTTIDECRRCSGRIFEPARSYCFFCSSVSAIVTTAEECKRCSGHYYSGTYCYSCQGNVVDQGRACDWDCPDGMVGSGGVCASCALSDAYIYSTGQEECAKCSNRFFYPSQNICVLCSFASNIPTTLEECKKCPNRFYSGGLCRLCAGTVSADKTSCIL